MPGMFGVVSAAVGPLLFMMLMLVEIAEALLYLVPMLLLVIGLLSTECLLCCNRTEMSS